MFHLPLIAIIAAVLAAQQAPSPQIGKTSEIELAFDWGGKDANDGDVTLNAAEFVFSVTPAGNPPAPPIRVLRDMAPIVVGENLYKVSDVFVNVPPDVYDITVRVRSVAGEWSPESNSITREIVSKKPRAPTNFRDVGRR